MAPYLIGDVMANQIAVDVEIAWPYIQKRLARYLAGVGVGSNGGTAVGEHALDGSLHTGVLAHSQAPWVATDIATAIGSHAVLPDVHHPRQHNIIASSDHTITGAAMSVVGATATNTLGLLTPSDNPGATSALLKSGNTGGLTVTAFTATTSVTSPLVTASTKVVTPLIESGSGILLDPASRIVAVDGVVIARPIAATSVGAVLQSPNDLEASYARSAIGYNAYWDPDTNLWNIGNNGANDAAIVLTRNNSTAIDLIFHASTGNVARTMDHATFTAGTKFTFTNAGRLGILNSSPGYELDVSGTARVTTSLTTPLITTATNVDLLIDPAGTGAVLFPNAQRIRTATFDSAFPITGWQINEVLSGKSALTIGSISADELFIKYFVADETRIRRGQQYWTYSNGTVSRNFTTPAALNGSVRVYFENSPAITGAIFVNNDWLMFQYIDNSGGGFISTFIWGQVSSYIDEGNGEQSWLFTLRNGLTSTTLYKGTEAIDFGASGAALIQLSVVDVAGSPYIKMRRWSGANPYTPSNHKTYVQLGNLGSIGNSYYTPAGDGIYIASTAGDERFLVADNNGLQLRGASIALYNGATQTVNLSYTGTDVWIGNGSANKILAWNGSALSLRANNVDVITLDTSGNSFFAGVMTIGSSGEIRQGTGTLGTNYTGLRIWRDGSVGRIGGYNTNVLQWYANTDGKLYAGAGNVQIHVGGIDLQQDSYLTPDESRALTWWANIATQTGNPTQSIAAYFNGLNRNVLELSARGQGGLYTDAQVALTAITSGGSSKSVILYSSGAVDLPGALYIPGTTSAGQINPNSDWGASLGTAVLRWNTLYVNQVIANSISGTTMNGQEWEYTGSMVIDANNAANTTVSVVNQGAGVASLDVEGNITLGGTVDGIDISNHAASANAHHNQSHVLATTSGLGADHTVSGLTVGFVLRATGSAAAQFMALTSGDITTALGFTPVNVTTYNSHIANANAHHNQSHVLATTSGLGADHTVSGLTAGFVLRATGSAAAQFMALTSGDITAALGYTPVNKTGDTMTGALTVKPGTNTASAFDVLDASNTVVFSVDTQTFRAGVGRNDPQAKLHIYTGADELLRLESSGATGNPYQAFFQSGTRRALIQFADTNDNLIIASEYGDVSIRAAATAGTDSDTTYITVKAGGAVGFGTSSPGHRVDISNSASTYLRVATTTTSATTTGFILRNAETSDAHTDWFVFAEKASSGAATGLSTFQIRRRNSGQTEAITPFVIDGNANIVLNAGFSAGSQTYGNVGIKRTPNAAYVLDVNGAVRTSGVLYADGGVTTATGGLSLSANNGVVTVSGASIGSTGWSIQTSGAAVVASVTTPTVQSAADLTVTSTSNNLILNGTSTIDLRIGGVTQWTVNNERLLPRSTVVMDLGDHNRRLRTIHAAELAVEILVASNVMATMGGRIVVAPTTKLIADVSTGATTIDVADNSFVNGEYIYLSAAPSWIAQIEAMQITSSPTTISGGFRYSVSRNLDGTGANAWAAGDAVVSHGASPGHGYIDLTSTTTIHNHYGPVQAFYVRTSSTNWNDVVPVVAVGNLRSFVGYSGNEFGFAAGNDLTLTATSGFRGVTIDRVSGLTLYNTNIRLYESSTLRAALDYADGLNLLADSSTTNKRQQINWWADLTNRTGTPVTEFYTYVGGSYGPSMILQSRAASGVDGVLLELRAIGNTSTSSLSLLEDSGGTRRAILNSQNVHLQWSGNERVWAGSGGVGINQTTASYALDVNGSCHASSFPTSSDRRFKEALTPLAPVLDRLERIGTYNFYWRRNYAGYEQFLDDGGRPQLQVGFVAQEVEQEFPELISRWRHIGRDGKETVDAYSVDYARMVPILVQAIRELRAELAALKSM